MIRRSALACLMFLLFIGIGLPDEKPKSKKKSKPGSELKEKSSQKAKSKEKNKKKTNPKSAQKGKSTRKRFAPVEAPELEEDEVGDKSNHNVTGLTSPFDFTCETSSMTIGEVTRGADEVWAKIYNEANPANIPDVGNELVPATRGEEISTGEWDFTNGTGCEDGRLEAEPNLVATEPASSAPGTHTLVVWAKYKFPDPVSAAPEETLVIWTKTIWRIKIYEVMEIPPRKTGRSVLKR